MGRNCLLCVAGACAVLSMFVLGCGPAVSARGGGASGDVGPVVVENGVRFSLFAPKAVKVTIAGDFNNWSAVSDPLFDREGKGLWTLVIPLSPGIHQYKFVIDGEKWIPDPGNPKRVADGFDGYNSIIDVGQPKSPAANPGQ